MCCRHRRAVGGVAEEAEQQDRMFAIELYMSALLYGQFFEKDEIVAKARGVG